MKVRITHLKAAWPEGAAIGSVVELEGDTIPAWALGKCQLVTGDSVPTDPQAAIDAAVKAATEPLQATVSLQAALIDEQKAKIAEQAATIEQLQALVPAAVGELVVNPAGADPTKPAPDAPAAKVAAKRST